MKKGKELRKLKLEIAESNRELAENIRKLLCDYSNKTALTITDIYVGDIMEFSGIFPVDYNVTVITK